MSNWNEMDQKILASMSEIGIPEEEVKRITPWNRATRKIIWGMILNLFTVAFYGLDLLLPFIGDILITLGLRPLKKTNKGFKRAYFLAWTHLSVRLVSIAGSATPIYEEEWLGLLQLVLLTAAFVAFLITLKQGIDQVIASRIGETKNPINGLIVWYVILVVVAATGLGAFLPVTVGLIIAMVYIVYKTLTLGRTLDNFGYAVVPTAIGISGKVLGTILIAIALITIVVFTLLFGRVDMNYEETALDVGQQQTRGMLIEKGFPKKVIADMKDEEVAGFADVEKVETQAAYSNGPGWDLEQILVLCETKDGDVLGVAWFKDKKGNLIQGIDGIVLDPSDPLKDVSGRILYGENGETYEGELNLDLIDDSEYSDYYRVGSKFSLPSINIKSRGYICFRNGTSLDEYIVFSIIASYYRSGEIPYPYRNVFEDIDNWDTNVFHERLPIQIYGTIDINQ